MLGWSPASPPGMTTTPEAVTSGSSGSDIEFGNDVKATKGAQGAAVGVTEQMDPTMVPPVLETPRPPSKQGCLRACASKWIQGQIDYFDFWAIVESIVCITSCVWVWVGWWGIWDLHLLGGGWDEDCSYFPPEEQDGTSMRFENSMSWQILWRENGATYTMLLVVAITCMFFTRTLYEKDVLRQIRLEQQGSHDEAAEQLAVPNSDAPSEGLSPQSGDLPRRSKKGRLYFRAPKWNWLKFTRASTALIVSFTFWVGMYNIVDYVWIPWVLHFFRDEDYTNWVCSTLQERLGIGLRLGLMISGFFGLYFTRALYGDVVYKAANAQRFN